jgi:hypothetical protein
LRPGRRNADQLSDAYCLAVHLRHELTQVGGADREIATAIAALDAVSLALAGATITAVERETAELSKRARHVADRG